MKTRFFVTILLVLAGFFMKAQNIRFVSESNGDPLSKISVFSEGGKLLATSNIDGNVSKSLLLPPAEKYILVDEGRTIATFGKELLAKTEVRLPNVEKRIEPLVFKNAKPKKYILVRGYFNSYCTLDQTLNVYADGVAVYIFDNKTKKLKDIRAVEYRTFIKNSEIENKDAGSFVFRSFLKIPEIEGAGIFGTEKNSSLKSKFKTVKTKNLVKYEWNAEKFQEKEFSLLGYRFFDMKAHQFYSYANETAALRDFSDFSNYGEIRFRHKTEEEFHQLKFYSNFIPTEFTFTDSTDLPGVKFNREASYYYSKFWEAEGFPNMQPVFSSFFKDSLHETPNSHK